MGAPAAPLVVEGGALAAITGALILAVIYWAAIFGIQQAYTYTLGALLYQLAKLLDRIPFFKIGSATVGAIDSFVQHQIGIYLTNAETNVARTWHGLTWVVHKMGQTIEFLAHATLDAVSGLAKSEIPQAVKGQVVTRVVKITTQATALAHDFAAFRKSMLSRVGALEHEVALEFGQAWRGIDALKRGVVRTLDKRIAAAAAAIGALGRYAHGTLNHRLTKLEKATVGAGVAAAVVATVARFWPWLRCSNVKRAGKRICRMDTSLLSALLDTTLIIGGSVSLVQGVKELERPTELVMDGLKRFIVEL